MHPSRRDDFTEFVAGRSDSLIRPARFEPSTVVDSPDVTVTAYGDAGRILGQRKNVKYLTAGRTGSESAPGPGGDPSPAEGGRTAPSPRLS
ncbi:hypothetical protein [Microtetraspora malaysiensis]|uniref:Uncharacterized protein n=1 Tax=Microtetraspora malaysiensis TaxID=161358 RepID=A0ABW6STB8_9ACTN